MTETKSTADSPLLQDFEAFTTHVRSLSTSLDMSMRVLDSTHDKVHHDFTEFAAKYCESGLKDGRKYYRPKSHDYCKAFGEVSDALDNSHIAGRVVPETFLVSLVSQYDAFIRSFTRDLLMLNRNTLRGCQAELKVSDLLTFASIDDAYRYVVEREIDQMMRGSHADQFDYFKQAFDLDWKHDSLWQKFVEVTERRNLFVHTNGYVTQQYLRVCKQHNVMLESTLKEGDKLSAGPKYFSRAADALLELATKVSQILWRKQVPTERASADRTFGEFTFELLATGRYELVLSLLNFATTTLRNKISDENYLLTFTVNTAIAYKEIEDHKRMAECLASTDWKQKNSKFRLAEAVLNERYHAAAELMKAVGKDMPAADYRHWPLFRDFIKTKEFQTAYEQVFGEPFSTELPNPHQDAGAGSCKTVEEPVGRGDVFEEAEVVAEVPEPTTGQ
jgi:hypothetical protein